MREHTLVGADLARRAILGTIAASPQRSDARKSQRKSCGPAHDYDAHFCVRPNWRYHSVDSQSVSRQRSFQQSISTLMAISSLRHHRDIRSNTAWYELHESQNKSRSMRPHKRTRCGTAGQTLIADGAAKRRDALAVAVHRDRPTAINPVPRGPTRRSLTPPTRHPGPSRAPRCAKEPPPIQEVSPCPWETAICRDTVAVHHMIFRGDEIGGAR